MRPSRLPRGRRNRIEQTLLTTLGGLLVAFLALPLLALVTTASWRDFSAGLQHPLVWPALRISLLTTTLSLLLVVGLGTPLAWRLAHASGRLARWIETLLQLPVVVPPAVAGLAMLLAFGRRGLLSGYLYPSGSSIAFTTAAVVMAEVFVSAPFFVNAATSAFRRIDPTLLLAARTCGAAPLRVFASIALPLAAPGLTAGAAMSWARALGEFGATLMFAGNLTGETQTLPLAIYAAFESDLRAAQALALVLVVVALGLLLAVRASSRSTSAGGLLGE
jgi:molybdate transport system permease protein